MRDTIRIERDAFLDEQEGRFTYRFYRYGKARVVPECVNTRVNAARPAPHVREIAGSGRGKLLVPKERTVAVRWLALIFIAQKSKEGGIDRKRWKRGGCEG